MPAGVVESIFLFGPFRLMPSARKLLLNDSPVKIGHRAFDILTCLVAAQGDLVGKAELYRSAWPHVVVEESNLRVHLTALRRLLGDMGGEVRPIVNVPGRGYRFAPDVTVLAALEAPPEQRADSPRQNPMPRLFGELIGRTHLIDKLVNEVAPQRLITLVGPGGIGKTSVAIRLAESWRDRGRREVEFIDLGVATEASQVRSVVALCLGLPSSSVLDEIIARLDQFAPLVVLDNCEHVLDEAARLADAIMGRTSALLVATSREALRIDGETVRVLPPLEVPCAEGSGSLGEIMRYGAVQLFYQRAMAHSDQFPMRDSDAENVAAICRRLDGIPLAVELAAARVVEMGVNALFDALDCRFDVLDRGKRTAGGRQQTLRAAIDWSYDLLDDAARGLLRHLGVFASAFTLEAVIGVIGPAGVEPLQVAVRLAELVSKSLLTLDTRGPIARYRLLETTRVYAVVKLIETDEYVGLQRRHAEFFLRTCQAMPPTPDTAPGALGEAWLTPSVEEVRKALDWAFSPGGDVVLGTRLTAASVRLWHQLTLRAQSRARVLAALERLDHGDPSTFGLRSELLACLDRSEDPQAFVASCPENAMA